MPVCSTNACNDDKLLTLLFLNMIALSIVHFSCLSSTTLFIRAKQAEGLQKKETYEVLIHELITLSKDTIICVLFAFILVG